MLELKNVRRRFAIHRSTIILSKLLYNFDYQRTQPIGWSSSKMILISMWFDKDTHADKKYSVTQDINENNQSTI